MAEEIFKALITSAVAGGLKPPSWRNALFGIFNRPFTITFQPYQPTRPGDPNNALDGTIKFLCAIIKAAIKNPSLFIFAIFACVLLCNIAAGDKTPGPANNADHLNLVNNNKVMHTEPKFYEIAADGSPTPITEAPKLVNAGLMVPENGYVLVASEFFKIANYINTPVDKQLEQSTHFTLKKANLANAPEAYAKINEYLIKAMQGELESIYYLGNIFSNYAESAADANLKKFLLKTALQWQKIGMERNSLPSTAAYADLLEKDYFYLHQQVAPSNSKESAIIEKYLQHTIKNGYMPALLKLAAFYSKQGRALEAKVLYKRLIIELKCDLLESSNMYLYYKDLCGFAYYSLAYLDLDEGKYTEAVEKFKQGARLDDQLSIQMLAYITSMPQNPRDKPSPVTGLSSSIILWGAGILFSLGYGVNALLKIIRRSHNIAGLDQLAKKINVTGKKPYQGNDYTFIFSKKSHANIDKFIDALGNLLISNGSTRISKNGNTVKINLNACRWIEEADIGNIVNAKQTTSLSTIPRIH